MNRDSRRKRSPHSAVRCMAGMRALGWTQEDIEKILAGPEQSSIHDIAGRTVQAWPVETLQATAVADLAEGSPAARRDQSAPDIAQKQIADAVWESVSAGDPIPLAEIARQSKKLSSPMQAYLLAACLDVKWYFKDLTKWKRDFDRAEKQAETARKKTDQERVNATSAIVGTAAAAVNAIPVVGQAVSAALAVGLGVYKAFANSNPLPVRKSEDQVRPGYEGVSVFWGFAREPVEDSTDLYLSLKQAVVQDPVAFSLPQVPPRTPFDFAPRLSAFREAAHQLGLYPEDKTQT